MRSTACEFDAGGSSPLLRSEEPDARHGLEPQLRAPEVGLSIDECEIGFEQVGLLGHEVEVARSASSIPAEQLVDNCFPFRPYTKAPPASALAELP